MTIGTIGAGRIAKAFTKHVSNAGYQVIMSNRSGGNALGEIAKSFGKNVKAGTIEEAATADMVLLSVPWSEVKVVLSKIKRWNGQILIDTTNAVSFPDFKPLSLGKKISSEIVADLASGSRVVKAFNTLEAATLASDPREAGGNRLLFTSSDDASAKAEVLGLIEKLGFAGVDLGALHTGGKLQEFGGPFIGKSFIKLR